MGAGQGSARVKGSILQREKDGPKLIYMGGEEWELAEDFDIIDKWRRLVIPVKKGFVFDLASVPRFLWAFISPFDLSIVAPMAHDHLYWFGGKVSVSELVVGIYKDREVTYKKVDPYSSYTRAQADELLRLLALSEGVDRWRAQSAYYAVRAFAGPAWGRGLR